MVSVTIPFLKNMENMIIVNSFFKAFQYICLPLSRPSKMGPDIVLVLFCHRMPIRGARNMP